MASQKAKNSMEQTASKWIMHWYLHSSWCDQSCDWYEQTQQKPESADCLDQVIQKKETEPLTLIESESPQQGDLTNLTSLRQGETAPVKKEEELDFWTMKSKWNEEDAKIRAQYKKEKAALTARYKKEKKHRASLMKDLEAQQSAKEKKQNYQLILNLKNENEYLKKALGKIETQVDVLKMEFNTMSIMWREDAAKKRELQQERAKIIALLTKDLNSVTTETEETEETVQRMESMIISLNDQLEEIKKQFQMKEQRTSQQELEVLRKRPQDQEVAPQLRGKLPASGQELHLQKEKPETEVMEREIVSLQDQTDDLRKHREVVELKHELALAKDQSANKQVVPVVKCGPEPSEEQDRTSQQELEELRTKLQQERPLDELRLKLLHRNYTCAGLIDKKLDEDVKDLTKRAKLMVDRQEMDRQMNKKEEKYEDELKERQKKDRKKKEKQEQKDMRERQKLVKERHKMERQMEEKVNKYREKREKKLKESEKKKMKEEEQELKEMIERAKLLKGTEKEKKYREKRQKKLKERQKKERKEEEQELKEMIERAKLVEERRERERLMAAKEKKFEDELKKREERDRHEKDRQEQNKLRERAKLLEERQERERLLTEQEKKYLDELKERDCACP